MPPGSLRGCTAFRLVAVLALVASACSPDPAQGDKGMPTDASAPGRTHSNTGARSELITDLPVLTAVSEAGKRVTFSQQVSVRAGQLLLAVAEFQTTNDLRVNVYVGSQIVLGGRPTDVTGRSITAANGENVTPDMHHGQQSRSGTYEAVAADAGTRYVNVVAWAAASRAAPGDLLRLDQGYGRLSVVSW